MAAGQVPPWSRRPEDIAERGLLHPIVLDREGLILDGRNRLAACRLVGVQPAFTTYEGDDPGGYALSVNSNRRDMTKGQKAMIAARSRLFAANSQATQEVIAASAGVSQERLAFAELVLAHAPELADAVMAGASLDAAYAVAQRRKAEARTREELEARDRARLWRYPTFEVLVARREWALVKAIAAIDAAEAEQERAHRAMAQEERIRLLLEEIGPEVPLPPRPDLPVDTVGEGAVPGPSSPRGDAELQGTLLGGFYGA